MPQLDDRIADAKVDVTYPDLTNQELLDFCEYFHVTFYSLRALSAIPANARLEDYFRVATTDFPSRGLDVTFHSVLSWKLARGKMVFDPQPGMTFDTPFAGRVVLLGIAQGIDEGDDPVVVLQEPQGGLRYLSKEKFLGMTYNRLTDEYVPNSLPVQAEPLAA